MTDAERFLTPSRIELAEWLGATYPGGIDLYWDDFSAKGGHYVDSKIGQMIYHRRLQVAIDEREGFVSRHSHDDEGPLYAAYVFGKNERWRAIDGRFRTKDAAREALGRYYMETERNNTKGTK